MWMWVRCWWEAVWMIPSIDQCWFVRGDFLLASKTVNFHHIINCFKTRRSHRITDCVNPVIKQEQTQWAFRTKAKNHWFGQVRCAWSNWIFMKGEADFRLTLIFVAFEGDSTLLMSCVHSELSCWTVIDIGCRGINMNDSAQTSITAEKGAATIIGTGFVHVEGFLQ